MKAGLQNLCSQTGWDKSKVYVWLDILSIPQTHVGIKLLAVYSLYMYAKQAEAMLIIAPPSRHQNTGEEANKITYKSRVWTRAEQFAHFCQHGMGDIYLVEGQEKIEVVDQDWMKSVGHVFEGQMTCCRLDHNNGCTPCDKESLVLPLVGLYYELHQKEKKGILTATEETALKFIQEDKDRMFPTHHEYAMGKGKTDMKTLFGDLIFRAEEYEEKSNKIEVKIAHGGVEEQFEGDNKVAAA